MYFFDTTAIIELFRGNEDLKSLLDKVSDDLALTSISYLEIFSKVYHRKLKNEKKYFTRFFANFPVYHFDLMAAGESSKIMGGLYRKGVPVNISDVMISGICLANGADGIITRDRDFRVIEEISELKAVFF